MKLLSCILIALAIVGVYGDEPDMLVGGIPTTINEYPHCISIRNLNQHMCGGSIIGPRHILTAAHCVEPLARHRFLWRFISIVSGTSYLSKGGQVHRVENMWYHEKYDPNHPAGRGPYDIGLIKLTEPIEFNSVQQQIPICTSNVNKNDEVTIAAWGATGFGQRVHDNLQKLDAKAMPPEECQEYHKNLMPVDETEVCTLITRGKGLCNGDSGSGLILGKNRCLIGCVSGGKPCAEGVPDVYTNVFSHRAWISEKMAY